MSLTKNKAIRCDWCGKLSRNPSGEYTKPDGISAGYINQPEWQRFAENPPANPSDICEECAAGKCPHCGSGEVVQLSPSVPGPDGWGGRCKACGQHWSMT